jgi:hypothetical protein
MGREIGDSPLSNVTIKNQRSFTPIHFHGTYRKNFKFTFSTLIICLIFKIWFSILLKMAKAAFKKKRALFTSTLDLELRKKSVKCYIWSIALYSAETWTLRAADQKQLESFEMW